VKVIETIYGDEVILRSIQESDARYMYAALQDDEFRRCTGTHPRFTFEQVRYHCAESVNEADRVDFAILSQDEHLRVMGEVVLNEIDEDNKSANFRIALYDKVYFGRGFAAEASRLIIGYAFNELQLHRISLEVYEFNLRAIKLYEKLGFQNEGVLRDSLYWGGQYYSSIMMATIKDK